MLTEAQTLREGMTHCEFHMNQDKRKKWDDAYESADKARTPSESSGAKKKADELERLGDLTKAYNEIDEVPGIIVVKGPQGHDNEIWCCSRNMWYKCSEKSSSAFTEVLEKVDHPDRGSVDKMKKLLVYARDQATERSLAPIRVVGLEEWLSMKDKLGPGELACQDGIFNVVTGGKLPYTDKHFITADMIMKMKVPTSEEWANVLQSDAYKYYEERMNEIYAEGALQHEVLFRFGLFLFDDDKNKGARDGLNLWGEGSNGKSVSPKLLQLGFDSHIVQSLTMSHIQPNPREDPNAPKTWPLDKDGARVLYSSEGKKNDTLNNSTVLEYNSVLAKAVHGGDQLPARTFFTRESKFGITPTYALLMFTNKPMEPSGEEQRDRDVIKSFKFPSLFVNPSELARLNAEAEANEAAADRARQQMGKEAAPLVPRTQYFTKRPIVEELKALPNHKVAIIRYHAGWYAEYLRRIDVKKLLGYYIPEHDMIKDHELMKTNDCLLKQYRHAKELDPSLCEETWWRSMTNEAPFKSEGGGEFGSFAEAASFIEPLAQSYGSFWEHKRTMGTTGMTVQHCFHEAFEFTRDAKDKVTRRDIVEKIAEKLGTIGRYVPARGVLPDTGHESDLVSLLTSLESQKKIVRCASKPTKYAMLRLKPEPPPPPTGQGGFGGPGYL